MPTKTVPNNSSGFEYTFDDTGLSLDGTPETNGAADWPLMPNGKPYKSCRLVIAGADCWIRTGDSTLNATSVKRAEDVPVDAQTDTKIFNGQIIERLERSLPRTDTKWTVRAATGQSGQALLYPLGG